MLRDTLVSKATKIVSAANWFFALSSAAISAALKAEPTQYAAWPRLAGAATWMRNSAWLSLPMLIVLIAVLNEVRAWVGSKTTWLTAQLLVNEYREQMFPNNTDPAHFHRVTLYKWVRVNIGWCQWPWSGWMQPVIRSGHRTKKGIPWFRASLNDPRSAKGVAGVTFTTAQQIILAELPKIDSATVGDDDFKTYAERAFVSVKWLRRRSRKENARSYWGVPIEVSGKPWGALVVDSQATKIEASPETSKTLLLLQRMLGKTLDSAVK